MTFMFYCLYTFAFCGMPCTWDSTVCVAFSDWLLSLTNMYLREAMVATILSEKVLPLKVLVIRTLIMDTVP